MPPRSGGENVVYHSMIQTPKVNIISLAKSLLCDVTHYALLAQKSANECVQGQRFYYLCEFHHSLRHRAQEKPICKNKLRCSHLKEKALKANISSGISPATEHKY